MEGTEVDLGRERVAFRATLLAVGPEATTNCGPWSVGDLAVHVALGETARGIPAATARALVARGVRIDRMGAVNRAVLARQPRRHGYDWAVTRLARRPPRSHVAGGIGAVSLLEVWAHHDDVLAANPGAGEHAPVDLRPVVATLRRYHRRFLDAHDVGFDPTSGGHRVEVLADDAALVRWLTGRSPLPLGTVTGPDGSVEEIRTAALPI